MISSLFMSFIHLVPAEARSHFSIHNHVTRRTNKNNSNLLTSSQSTQYNSRRHLSSIPAAFLTIRGGSDEGDNNYDEDDNFSDFVSSFESDLMEIRLEAELEAEAELEKLRMMLGEQEPDEDTIDQGSDVEEEDEGADEQQSSDEVLDDDDEEEANDVRDVEDSAVEEETNAVSDNEEQISMKADEVDQMVDEDEGITEDQLVEESESGEENDLVVESEEESVKVIDDSSSIEEDTVIVTTIDESDSTARGKPKKSKAKKSKSDKPTSKSNKSSRRRLDDIDSLSEGDIGNVDSVVLTRTVERVVESQPTGISGFLKSDLFRALTLLIATVVVSIMMQRLQRQMEAQGL